jgi:hypothetical protein
MKLKDAETLRALLLSFRYDERNNIRPAVQQALIIVEKERLTRLRQRQQMKDNLLAWCGDGD